MTINTIFSVIKYSSALSILIPITFCIINFKTLNNLLRVLFFYCVITVLMEGIGFFLFIANENTYMVQNSFTLLETTLLLIIYYLKFETKNQKRLIVSFYCLFIALSIYLFIIKKGFNKQDNILNTFESAVFMSCAYFYFFILMKELKILKITDDYFTWINAAILIYFSAGFVMFLFNEYIENLYINLFYLVYCLYLISSIAFNIILSMGIWKNRLN